MKQDIVIITLLIFANLFTQGVFADENNTSNRDMIIQVLASNDVHSVIGILPDIENLWPQQPEIYFQFVKKTSSILANSPTNADARQLQLGLFLNTIQKKCPTNASLAISCLKAKRDAIAHFLNLNEIKNDKSSWIAAAKFIGEIRSQIIPDFIPKEVYLNPRNDLSLSPQQLQQAIEENEQNKAINGFQQELRISDSFLTFCLLHNVGNFPTSDSNNTNFLKEVISAAHLTEKERSQLQ